MKTYLFPIFFLILVALTIFIAADKVQVYKDYPLNWDEVDYANAARKGILVNAIEAQSLSFKQFVMLSLLKKNKEDEKIGSLNLPEESEDIFLLRHFHPPFPVYYWHIFAHNDGERMTENIRFGNVLWLIFSALFSIFCLWFSSKNSQEIFFGAGVMAIFWLSSNFIESHYLINFHSFHLVACLFFCSALFRYVEQPNQANSFWLSLGFVLLIGTLEMGIMVAGAALFLGLLSNYRKVLFSTRKILELLLMTIGLLIILWAGIFRTLSPLKAFMTYFYRIFANSNEEYARVSYFDNWLGFFVSNPFLFATILLGMLYTAYLIWKKCISSAEMIPLLLGLTYAIVMTPFMLAGTYVLPAIGMIFFGIALIVMQKPIVLQFKVLLLLISICALGFQIAQEKVVFPQTLAQHIQQLKTAFMPILSKNDHAYANGAHILNFYLGNENKLTTLERYSIGEPDFYVRKNYKYQDIKPIISTEKVDVIVLLRWMKYSPEKMNYLAENGFVMTEYKEWLIFEKTKK